jgi:hypothetical protein
MVRDHDRRYGFSSQEFTEYAFVILDKFPDQKLGNAELDDSDFSIFSLNII